MAITSIVPAVVAGQFNKDLLEHLTNGVCSVIWTYPWC